MMSLSASRSFIPRGLLTVGDFRNIRSCGYVGIIAVYISM